MTLGPPASRSAGSATRFSRGSHSLHPPPPGQGRGGGTSGRRAYTLLEILVAAGIFVIAVVYAVGTTFYNRRAADRTERVDEYREMRIVYNRIARDLQDASRVQVPTYDFHSFRLELRDNRDRDLLYVMRDDAGTELTAEPAPDDTHVYRLVRILGTGASASTEVIRQTSHVAFLKFTRLGERLLGLTVKMRSTEKDRPGGTYTAAVSLNRVMM